MNKNYYEILGVEEFENTENIKIAYRKLARQYHPDIAGNSDEIIKKFKDINEAYSILSDKIKKEEYDRARKFYNYATGNKTSEPPKPSTEKNPETTQKNNKKSGANNIKWEKIFNKYFSSTNKSSERRPEKGSDISSDIEISLMDAIYGTTKTLNMLKTEICPVCGGRKFVNGSTCKHCKGKGEFVSYKKFSIKIPAGIKNNSKIRLKGEGNEGKNGGAKGDIYVTVHVKEDKNNNTVQPKILSITPYEAVLGTKVNIKTEVGNFVVTIPAGIENGQKIRIANSKIMQNNALGDMIITVEIKTPQNLSKEEIDLYKKLSEISSSKPREDINEY